MSTNSEKYPLGSIGNPYDEAEFKRLRDLGFWEGGFVWIEKGETAHYVKRIIPSMDGCASSSGSGTGCGSDSGSGSLSNSGCCGESGCGDESFENGDGNLKEGDASGSDIIIRYDSSGKVQSNGKDCFFKCMEYVGGKMGMPYSSEEYRLDYYQGYLNSSSAWKGTGNLNEYIGGPIAMTKKGSEEPHPNKDIESYLGCFFNVQLIVTIDGVKSLFPRDGECLDGGLIIGFFKTNDNPNDYSGHAVIIQKNNRGSLYIYDAQSGMGTRQYDTDDEESKYYKDSRFMYAYKLKAKSK